MSVRADWWTRGPAVVYIHRDKGGNVLYVGSTCNLAKRTAEHRRSSHWWPKVAVVEEDNYPCGTYSDAYMRESWLIRELTPLHNKIKNPKWLHRNEPARATA